MYFYRYFRTVIVVFVLMNSVFISLRAQETLAVGQVVDAQSLLPIPNVNIVFKNTETGVKSTDDGYFMLRTMGNETTLVFSCIGYQTKEYKLKKGQSVGMQVELREQVTDLTEVLVLPGTNPAMELMKRIRAAKKANNIRVSKEYAAQLKEEQLVLLTGVSPRSVSKKIFAQLMQGAVQIKDSSLTLPVYISEKTYRICQNEKSDIRINTINANPQFQQIVEQFTGELSADLNFYQHTVFLFGKEFVSPLSDVGNAFYRYYLTDSLSTPDGKEYHIEFRSANRKNLAFNGNFIVDSASLALKHLKLTLSSAANINFVQQLSITQQFRLTNHRWIPDSSVVGVALQMQLKSDSLNARWPQLYMSNRIKIIDTEFPLNPTGFAGTKYASADLNARMADLNATPVMRAARWVADVILTGYMQFGKIDIGKVQQLARTTDVEGLRLTLPFRTNERLWSDISVGGYVGYGFKNKELPYSAFASYKLPFGARNIFSASYSTDYRRVDYDYDDFQLRENPLQSGDEDALSTIFSFRSASKVGRRRELLFSFTSDIVKGIETGLFFRSNRIYSSVAAPHQFGSTAFDGFLHQSLSLNGRFSFGQRFYNDHLQRIYGRTHQPVVYTTLLAGQYRFASTKGQYAKLQASVVHDVPFGFGSWKYVVSAGLISGKVPYQLLFMPSGSETAGYSAEQFSSIYYMEYAADTYAALHNEIHLNGIILNYIPLIKHLNLREMLTFKYMYGTLRQSHSQIMDVPASIYAPDNGYAEVGVGVSNILRIFTLQSVWRLSGLQHPGTSPWALKGSISVRF